jgi:hypothetical protein
MKRSIKSLHQSPIKFVEFRGNFTEIGKKYKPQTIKFEDGVLMTDEFHCHLTINDPRDKEGKKLIVVKAVFDSVDLQRIGIMPKEYAGRTELQQFDSILITNQVIFKNLELVKKNQPLPWTLGEDKATITASEEFWYSPKAQIVLNDTAFVMQSEEVKKIENVEVVSL